MRPFKIILYTVRGIGEHDIFIRAAALAFYTILSIVPVAALIFGFMKGFGFDEKLWEWIYAEFPDSTGFINDYMRGFVDNMLAHTRGGVIAIVGVVVLFWAVIRVFTTIEASFNDIWEVKNSRGIVRQLSDYLAVVIVSPILLISANTLSSIVRSNLDPWVWSWLLDAIFALAELLLIWLLFAFLYWVMPNTKVRFKGAVIAAVIAGTAFWLFQQAYFAIQSSISSNNAIYGTFAAIPLLLAWLQSSWIIVLVGAELSFAYQNIGRYELERQAVFMNARNKRKIVVATMGVIAQHFVEGGGGVSAEEIATELGLPVRSVRDVIWELELTGLVVSVNSEHEGKVTFYMPARDVSKLTVFDVVERVDNDNAANLDVSGLAELKAVSDLLDEAVLASRTTGMATKVVDLYKKKR